MKKTAFSLAAMAVLAAAGAAHAQSNVTLYGRLDAGVSNTSNAGPIERLGHASQLGRHEHLALGHPAAAKTWAAA